MNEDFKNNRIKQEATIDKVSGGGGRGRRGGGAGGGKRLRSRGIRVWGRERSVEVREVGGERGRWGRSRVVGL